MKNLKAFQKNQLIYEFGILFQPFEDLIRADQPPSISSYRIAIAKVQAGRGAWQGKVTEFATFAPDVFFRQENKDVSLNIETCLRAIKTIIDNEVLQDDLMQTRQLVEQEVVNARKKILKIIDTVPVEWEPVLFEANTPFTSYLRIKETIVSVKQRLHYFDRYLKPDFFQLFLSSVNSDISIRLITTAGNLKFGITSVSAVSNLARQQFSDYQLIEVDQNVLHDRNLRVDNQIFTLGPGVDRAGLALTNFGPSDSSIVAHDQFDNIIASGRVIT